jgi:hypothetical protein
MEMDNDNVMANRKDQDALSQVASLIRPLPDNVVPSDEFLRRTRVRLLKLDAKPASSGQQAA